MQYASRVRARATLEELKVVAARRAHAHKATAQPLEVAAAHARGGGSILKWTQILTINLMQMAGT